MKEFFKTNKPIKISMIVLALFLVIIIPYALSENKGNNNKTINATEKETSKETKKETNKETKKEVVKKETNKETKKEKETSKKDDKNQKTQNNEKKSQSKTSNSNINNSNSTNYQQSSQTTQGKQVKRTTETQTIPFNTIDNYAYTGGKSRVYQDGRSGVRTIVRENGEIVSNTVTASPQDKIIERYVKTKDAQYETVEKEVDDLDKPVYRRIVRERWFVNNQQTGEIKYFYSSTEAYNYFEDNAILGNWGTADDEVTYSDVIIGYDTKIITEKVKVSDEVWEWLH